MSPKLASAIVCIGIAVGSLSAPRAPSSGSKPGHLSQPAQPSIGQSYDKKESSFADSSLTDDALTTVDPANASPGAIAESLEFALPPAEPDTNTFGVATQQ